VSSEQRPTYAAIWYRAAQPGAEWAAAAEESGFSTLGTVSRVACPGVMGTVAPGAVTRTPGRSNSSSIRRLMTPMRCRGSLRSHC